MKPRLKLRCSGEIDVLRAGRCGMSDESLRAFMKRRSGSVARYCASLRLEYPVVVEALRRGAYLRAGKVGYARLLLGLAVAPSKGSLALSEKVYGDSRIRGLLGTDLVVSP